MTTPVTPMPATLRVREHLAQDLRPGATLPSVQSLARGTGLSVGEVKTALHQLNDLGFICYEPRDQNGRRILCPDLPHPHDTEAIATIRKRILNRIYRPGEALPVGILARQFGLTARQVTHRACRQLIAEGLVHHDSQGPHGPGVYVTQPTSQSVPHRVSPSHEPAPHRVQSPNQLSGGPR
ncbi:GntR family transcriptional regulator [Streptomyces sp. NPDC058409]|uniref:GntR family transcriptional regulator n=1 Tax=Streptomyces sp. NPDC058409 TaxID=3346484 RepID=UPI003663C7EC